MQFIILSYFFTYIFSEILLPIKIIENENFNEINNIIMSNLYISTKIGTNKQNINLLLKFSTYQIYLSDYLNNKNYFNYNKSNSFIIYDSNSSFYLQDFKEHFFCKDNFYLDKIQISQLNFVLAKELLYYNVSGCFGLKINDANFNVNTEFNLIKQLKKKDIINSYCFTLLFDNKNNNGEILIGDYPHEIKTFNDKYLFEENNFFYTKSYFQDDLFSWSLVFDNITHNNQQVYHNYNIGELQIEIGGIVAPNYFQDMINVSFFKVLFESKKCEIKITNISLYKYIYYTCDKDVNIKEFKEINFYIKNIRLNISLNYNDLFIKRNNKYVFLIFFKDYSFKKWILGKPFLKKEIFTFDLDKKIIGYYKNKNYYVINNNKLNLNLILLLFLSFVLIIILVIILFKKKINFRKKYANELNDQYEYNTDYKSINLTKVV